ncbi:MAG: MBL fold metallo-hydrolase [Bacilli bacterium]|nr:MBL fold metallo-hydrolase [Bacilli bacterium]
MPCLCTKKDLKFQTLASGSKGNCAIVLCDNINLIIDAGILYSPLKKRLEENNLYFSSFFGILITHSHADHIKGLKGIIKNTNLKILIPEEMYEELKEIVPKNQAIFIKNKNKLGSITIELIHTSHDTACSVGYIITYKNKSLVYITDTGYINRKYLKMIENKYIYLIESNHDEEMLMNGPYPPFLKQRVISDRGHLSNRTTASYLKQVVGENTKYVVLAHLSEQNNDENLALKIAKEALFEKNIELIIAHQNEVSPVIEV